MKSYQVVEMKGLGLAVHFRVGGSKAPRRPYPNTVLRLRNSKSEIPKRRQTKCNAWYESCRKGLPSLALSTATREVTSCNTSSKG